MFLSYALHQVSVTWGNRTHQEKIRLSGAMLSWRCASCKGVGGAHGTEGHGTCAGERWSGSDETQ